jgi:hypothetical protein
MYGSGPKSPVPKVPYCAICVAPKSCCDAHCICSERLIESLGLRNGRRKCCSSFAEERSAVTVSDIVGKLGEVADRSGPDPQNESLDIETSTDDGRWGDCERGCGIAIVLSLLLSFYGRERMKPMRTTLMDTANTVRRTRRVERGMISGFVDSLFRQ